MCLHDNMYLGIFRIYAFIKHVITLTICYMCSSYETFITFIIKMSLEIKD